MQSQDRCEAAGRPTCPRRCQPISGRNRPYRWTNRWTSGVRALTGPKISRVGERAEIMLSASS